MTKKYYLILLSEEKLFLSKRHNIIKNSTFLSFLRSKEAEKYLMSFFNTYEKEKKGLCWFPPQKVRILDAEWIHNLKLHFKLYWSADYTFSSLKS